MKYPLLLWSMKSGNAQNRKFQKVKAFIISLAFKTNGHEPPNSVRSHSELDTQQQFTRGP